MKGNRVYILLIALLVLLLFYLRYCHTGAAERVEKVTVKRDTVYQVIKDTMRVVTPRPKLIIKRDTSFISQALPADSAEWLRLYYNNQILQEEYYAKRFYQDTIPVRFGQIITYDTIYENKIYDRKVVTEFNIPTVSEKITVQAPSRTAIYAGLGVLGGRTDFIRGYEGTLLLKTKNDQMYEVGGVMLSDGNLYLKAAVKFKISFKKKAR